MAPSSAHLITKVQVSQSAEGLGPPDQLVIVHSCFSVQNLSHGFGHKAQYVPTTAIHGSGNRHLAPSSTSLFHMRQEERVN